ncbi:MAG: hypothetical protein JNL41_16850 [Phenylobacterium sp.]|uniref:hypothetical protein n=1 Tax=Phenylobacterium sp. TaxID=1871053 RepID=UPI001A457724|nr:hypothetical protein [Phenylobacterium sp.]MBL8555948.1 hypothetical protein [Phenylobacterium sp.]
MAASGRGGAPDEDGTITEYAPFAGPAPPAAAAPRTRRRRGDKRSAEFGVRGGLAFAVIAAPRMNAAAWFGLAVAVPCVLLALAASVTQAGLPQAAGLYSALLLTPAVLLALNSLEKRRAPQTPAEMRDHDLAHALVLTVGQACGLLFVVMLGVRFSGEAIAVGLAMAGTPLFLAVLRNVWRRAVKPLDERLAPTFEASAGRNWTAEWLEAELQRNPIQRGAPVTVLRPRPASRVTLTVTPAPVDEGWMRAGDEPPAARVA